MTATRNAAEALGMLDRIGTLEAGKLADVVAVDGNPVHDIRVLQQRDRIKLVMKEGDVYVDRLSRDPKYVIHPHPTLSESVMESAEVFFGQSTHVYKPKRK